MVDSSAGQRSWPLSPYDLNVSYGKPGDVGLGPDWFGPLEPITPLAPPEVAGRQWDYLSGYNLSTFPRGYAPISFATLRGLADSFDLLRLVIETRKDQVARLAWTIAPRDKKASNDPRIASLRKFFAKPDGRHGFSDWLRLLLEDLFVIDAPTLYLSRDRSGRLLGLLPIDGATIKPVIDDWGRTPLPYVQDGQTVFPTAYQQILKGYPAVDYSVRDCLYRPRNIRVDRAYGFSPVEQIVTTVNIGLRRQAYLLDYFTQGNIPDSLIGVPENWTPDQIASYQKYWDAYFDGDLARRRRAKFVPGGVAKTFVQTREPDLKGPFDEWLARLVCFAFSVSPQAMTQQMNRATAETQKEIAEEEGLAPILCWVKALIDDVLADEFDSEDLEFSWSTESSIDPQTQEAILSSYATKGILTINEARVALGREPLTEAAANEAMVLTGSGYVPLGQGAPKQEPPAQKRQGIAKYNHYHDDRGRFTTADGVGSAADHSNDGRVQVAEIGSDIPSYADPDPDRARKRIVDLALSEVGSDAWDFDKRKGLYPPKTDKCNKFVYDMLTAAGASPGEPNQSQHIPFLSWPPTAEQWADPTFDIPGWRVLGPDEKPVPGDVAAQKIDWPNGATGHVAIVGPDGTIIEVGQSEHIEHKQEPTNFGPIEYVRGSKVYRRWDPGYH